MFQPSETLLDPPAIPLHNLNLNVLNSNFARFEEKVAFKGLGDDDQENVSSAISLTRIKARPSAATSLTKTIPDIEVSRKSSHELANDSQAQDFILPEFISSVPRSSRQVVSLQEDLPPMPGFYPPAPRICLLTIPSLFPLWTRLSPHPLCPPRLFIRGVNEKKNAP